MSKHDHVIKSQKNNAELLCPWCSSIVNVHPAMFFKTDNKALLVLCPNCVHKFYAVVIYLTNVDEKRLNKTAGIAIKTIHDYDEELKREGG